MALPTTTPLEDWVGRTQKVVDTINPVQVRQMAATLDDTGRMRDPEMSPLPAGWHWLYFNPLESQTRLGPDGHPLRGEFLPPVPLSRRMWAGSRLTWSRRFDVGTTVERTSQILKVAQKAGRSGQMVFVTVAHRYADSHGQVLAEEQDIVYRDGPSAVEKAALAEVSTQVRANRSSGEAFVFERAGRRTKAVRVDPVMLFRYSAATFNGHRIHYDVDYCRDVEGYPGLVVHGPFIATLLLGWLESEVAKERFISAFEFRAIRPTFDLNGFHLHASQADEGNTLQVWSTDNVGQVGIDGRVTLK